MIWWISLAIEKQEENKSVFRKQTCHNSIHLAYRRWSIFENGAVVNVSSLTNSHGASVNPEFGATMARRLNQSRVPAVPQSNLIAVKFGTAKARRLNCALETSNWMQMILWKWTLTWNKPSCFFFWLSTSPKIIRIKKTSYSRSDVKY